MNIKAIRYAAKAMREMMHALKTRQEASHKAVASSDSKLQMCFLIFSIPRSTITFNLCKCDKH